MKTFETINVEAAKSLLDTQPVTVVDIRDKDSYDEAHIQKAVRVDGENLQDFVQAADKNKPLICYCYHGISSQSAADYFLRQGFEKVYNIEGGFEAWRSVYPQ